ncbi:crustacyanin-C1 subunit-like [Macrobrachium rosenbergii]|uniref:crustacyanin-C1 subunit-like n=1 Tax=Macrobrachium rosenbergii TaxID=79674 RepID=UPI0034D661FE
MKVLFHSLIASVVVATILAVGGASAVATEDFVVPGSCPFVDELKLWNEQKEQHWKLGGNWYWHSYTPNPYQPIEKCVKMRLQYDAESTFRTYASGLDSNGEPIRTQECCTRNLWADQNSQLRTKEPPQHQ